MPVVGAQRAAPATPAHKTFLRDPRDPKQVPYPEGYGQLISASTHDDVGPQPTGRPPMVGQPAARGFLSNSDPRYDFKNMSGCPDFPPSGGLRLLYWTTSFKKETRRMTMKLARAALLLTLAAAAWAQVNVGEQKPEATLPFKMTTAATFELPWRIAFLPDGRMLVTEKIGPDLAGIPAGRKDRAVGRYARRLLAGPERHAGRLRLAPLRHRPEHLHHLYRAG